MDTSWFHDGTDDCHGDIHLMRLLETFGWKLPQGAVHGPRTVRNCAELRKAILCGEGHEFSTGHGT